MIALLQRVCSARVEVEGSELGAIGRGLLVFIAVQPNDDEAHGSKLLDRVLNYRVFSDAAGKMNLSLTQVQGGLLLIPQFTLAADTAHGSRPGFSTAATPELGRRLFGAFLAAARSRHGTVAAGEFGEHMQVSLTNDGPVTFWLET